MLRRLYQRLFLALSLLIGAQSAPVAAADEFADWHLPLPAGEWAISRGPCGGETPYDHPCGYYEDDCALDLVRLDGGDITGTPVLAPQTGTVVYLGRRTDAGIALMIEHADGRVSALFHLSRAVAGLGQAVGRGEVVAYAGSTGTNRPHLHFHVQKNIVERECVRVDGIDAQDHRQSKVVSANTRWESLTLVDPPQSLLDSRPALSATSFGANVNARLALWPRKTSTVRVRLAGVMSGLPAVYVQEDGRAKRIEPVQGIVTVLLRAGPKAGEASTGVFRDAALTHPAFQLRYSVSAKVDGTPADGVQLINPEFVSPVSFSAWDQAPRLCWHLSNAVKKPVQFRVRVVGPQSADSALSSDSGWLAATCWQPPSLPKGTYFWKVFVQDGDGLMNRTNQRPRAFVVR